MIFIALRLFLKAIFLIMTSITDSLYGFFKPVSALGFPDICIIQ